jgi:hypothetical protein
MSDIDEHDDFFVTTSKPITNEDVNDVNDVDQSSSHISPLDDGAAYPPPNNVEQAGFRAQTLLRALTHAKEARIASLRNKSRRAREESEHKLAKFSVSLAHIDDIVAALESTDASSDAIVVGGAHSLPRAVAKVAVDRHRRVVRQNADAESCAAVDIEAWHQRIVDSGRRELTPLSDGERSIALISTASAALYAYEKWRRYDAGLPPLITANRKRSLEIRQHLAQKQQQRAATTARQTGQPMVVVPMPVFREPRERKPKPKTANEEESSEQVESKEATTAAAATAEPTAKEKSKKKEKKKDSKREHRKKKKKESTAEPTEPAEAPPVYASKPQATRANVLASNGYASQSVKLSSLFLDSLSGEKPARGAKQKRPAPSSGSTATNDHRSAKQSRPAVDAKSFVRPWERQVNNDVKPTRTAF